MPMVQGQLPIINKRGLHARAAAKLVGVASQFNSEIRIGFPEQMADGKNIMSLLMLAAAKDTLLHTEIQGSDAEQAFAALTDLFARRFDEED